jgi:lipopolysaccharide transport system permease protein
MQGEGGARMSDLGEGNDDDVIEEPQPVDLRALKGEAARGLTTFDGPIAPASAADRHSAVTHKWVIRTSEADQIPTVTRWSTSWPLLVMYSKRQVQLRYRQSALGLAWTLIQPIAIMAIYGFVFTQFLDVSSDGDPYLSMAWSGLTVWMFVQATLQSGVMSLLNDSYMLGKIWFPREIIPLSPVMAGLVDLGMAGIVLVVVVLAQGASIGINWIALVPIFVVLMLWVSAISVFTATLNIFLRDLATIVGLGLRLMFIATPVMYPATVVPLNLSWVLTTNPFAVVIVNVRAVMIGGDWPNWELIVLHGVLGAAFLSVSLWYLRSVERRMVDVI